MSEGKMYHLRWVMLVEGISCLVLFFIAMPLKYIWGMNMAVSIAGGLHGFLFCWACLALLIVHLDRTWDLAHSAKYLIAIIPPGGMLLTEKWIKRDIEAAPSE
jgi:integral membrane protein